MYPLNEMQGTNFQTVKGIFYTALKATDNTKIKQTNTNLSHLKI